MAQETCEHKTDGICVACYDPDAVERYAKKADISLKDAAEQMRQMMDDYGLEVDDSADIG